MSVQTLPAKKLVATFLYRVPHLELRESR
eukprot:COSAG06_NODE_75216_length_133_cov_51.823529_1_plen_28_part_01